MLIRAAIAVGRYALRRRRCRCYAAIRLRAAALLPLRYDITLILPALFADYALRAAPLRRLRCRWFSAAG